MIPLKFIVLVCVAVVSGLGAVANALWGPRAQARKRLERSTHTTIADGEIVTLTGAVRARGDLLEAPLTGTPCVLYEAVGRLYSASGNGNQRTLDGTVFEQKLVPFELETADGVVLVDGEHAEVALPRTPCIPRRIDRERTFLLERGQSAEDIRYAGFDELRILPGDKIRVQGMVVVDIDPGGVDERDYRADAPRRIRVVPHADHPLTIGRARR